LFVADNPSKKLLGILSSAYPWACDMELMVAHMRKSKLFIGNALLWRIF
jgi:hypothetical protein